MKKILFVCTGNTCRSPMAEVIFRDLVEKEGLKDIEVMSAGIFAVPEDRANPNAIDVMKKRGLSLENHKSTMLTADILEEADLILTMTIGHKEVILQNYPELEEKIFTLKEYVNNPEDIKNANDINISDPFGQSIAIYKKNADEIMTNLKKLLEKVKEM